MTLKMYAMFPRASNAISEVIRREYQDRHTEFVVGLRASSRLFYL